MIQRFGLFLLTLPVAAAISAVPAQAQFYPEPPPYYRGAPPPGVYQDRLPPPGYGIDEDDDDQVVRPPRRAPQATQNQRGAPNRILPYPDEEADIARSPGFIPPDRRSPGYGHQLNAQQPSTSYPPAISDDPDAIRPPGAIGVAPRGAPQLLPPAVTYAPPPAPPAVTSALPPEDQPEEGQPKELPPHLKKQLVSYPTREPAGTVIIDTPNTYLYLVLGNGQAIRYGIGVGREGFTWAGTERISKMSEWPDWHPPSEMIERQPYLPRFMAGGPGNPLGARALYLGKTLYRIHGTNQPSTIGQTVSSGCIRLINGDIEDLFSRVQVGTRVVVLPGRPPETASNALPSAGGTYIAPQNNGTAISGSPLPSVR
jgi:lipoprotein-anchoring transpeptidase ErfK/SrfK